MLPDDVPAVEKKIEALRQEMRTTLDRRKLAELRDLIKVEVAKLARQTMDEANLSRTKKTKKWLSDT